MGFLCRSSIGLFDLDHKNIWFQINGLTMSGHYEYLAV